VHALAFVQPLEQFVEARVVSGQPEDLGGLEEHRLDVVGAFSASDARDGEFPIEGWLARLGLSTHVIS
jgi:hypothetical protein